MTRIFVAPPFDITHTVMYQTIDDKMALKLAKSHVFPDYKTLLGLADSALFRIRDAKDIIDSSAQGILEYLAISNEVALLAGLKDSIEKSVAIGMNRQAISVDFRHDKKRKFE